MKSPEPRAAEASLQQALTARFGQALPLPDLPAGEETLTTLAGHSSCRHFDEHPVDPDLVRLLCAVALSAPSKSDLQQRDIIALQDPTLRREFNALVGEQAWAADAPVMLVLCGNNRRQRLNHHRRGRPFANDHLDAFFNAAVDAGIALATLVSAAEAVGLGCCPLSAVRNRAQQVSDLLRLPDHVFPLSGLALGWPQRSGAISHRLPLDVTVHTDGYAEEDLGARIEDYDRRRAAADPYPRQLFADEYGQQDGYGWSEHTTRQYSRPERADFGAYIRSRGFDLR